MKTRWDREDKMGLSGIGKIWDREDMKFVQLIQVSTMDKIEEQIKNSKYSATFSMIAMLFKKPC